MSYFPASFHSRQLTHPEWPWKKGGCAVRIITQSITDYSQANGMIFILEQVHIISIYFSVLVHVIPKWHLVPIQVTPARMSSFRFSIWMKFSLWYVSFWYHVNRKWTLFQIENHQSCSLGLAVNMHLRGVYMRKIALAWVSHRDDFLILYRVYMMTGSIHILLFKGTFCVDKIHMWFKIANITYALPVPVYRQTDFTPKQVVVSCLHDTVARFRTGVRFLPGMRTGVSSPGVALAGVTHAGITFCGGIM